MTLTSLEPRFLPSLHSYDILCSIWPILAEYSVCAPRNYALFASHHNKCATRVSHTGIYHTAYLKRSPVVLSQPHGTAAELNTMGSGRLHSQDCIVKRGKKEH